MIQSRNAALRRTPAGILSGTPVAAVLLFVAALVFAALSFTESAHAADHDVFTVADVAVDATAASAASARDQALAAGQVKAFQRLMDRLVLVSDRARAPSPGIETVSELVRDFEVADEKTSAVRYLAKMTVRFRDDAVRALLREHGVAFAETMSKPLLVLPVYEVSGALSLWYDLNPWREAWSKVPPSDGLVPLMLPTGDLQDMATISPEQAVSGDDERLKAIARRYGAADVLIARAAMRFPDGPAADGGSGAWLQVTLSRFGTVQLEQTQVESFHPQPGETQEALLARAAATLARQVEETWKRSNRLRFDTGDELTVEVPLRSLEEWLEIRRRLGQVAFIRRSDLVILTRSAALLRLNFLGAEDQLRLALAQNDLVLDRGAINWVLRLRGNGDGGKADEQ